MPPSSRPRIPDAAALATLPATPLVRGRWIKADVDCIDWDGRKIVVKTFRRKSFLVRWLGRQQIDREARAYEALAGLAGIPALLGRPDAHTLLLEHVVGERLTHLRLQPGRGRQAVEALQRLVEAVHGRGVAHLDLRGRDNVLATTDGRLHLIDFAAASVFPAGSWRRRVLFPRLRSIDRSALLKWKRLLTPEDLTEKEQARLRRYGRWRRLWVFNRKELGPSDRAAREAARRAPR